jgi:uncharacterized protein YxjI
MSRGEPYTHGVEDPFALDELRIRQPGKVLPERASYEIFDTRRNLLAVARETERRSLIEALASEVPKHRAFAVTTARHEPLLTMVMPDEWRAELTEPDGRLIGRIKVGSNRREYTLLDDQDMIVCEAEGDLSVTKFAITGPAGEHYGQLRKTWAGVRKELFTEADNYTLTFTGQVPARVRRLIVMLPIVLDLSAHGPY